MKVAVHERQHPLGGMAQRFYRPPPEFAQASSNAVLEAIVEPVRVDSASPSAHLTNWARTFATDDASTDDGAFSQVSRHVFAPSSIEHVVAIVELARRHAMPTRAVGRRHSPSDLPFSLGWTVRTDELHGIVHLDTRKREVCVLAGTYIETLSASLAKHGFGFSNLGSISQQTIAGLISTASHGSGIHFPAMSAYVRALDVVCPLASGTQVVHCDRDERPDLFNASLCGLGATGVIVTVTLAIEPAFRLRQVCEDVPEDELLGAPDDASLLCAPDQLSVEPYDTFIEHPSWLGTMLAHGVPLPSPPTLAQAPTSKGPAHVYPFEPASAAPPALIPWHVASVQAHIESLVASAEHVRFLWSPHAHMITVDRASRTDERRTPSQTSRIAPPLIKALLFASRFHASLPAPVSRAAFALTHARAPPVPRNELDTPGGLRPVRTDTAISVRVDDAPRVFNFDCLCEQYTTEYAVPFEYTGAALVAIRAWLQEEHARPDGERIHFPIEVRFVDADGIWLSPSYGRRTCYIGLVQYRPYRWPVRYRRLFARFEALMRQFDGRPHWAKTHTAYRPELLTLYPHLPDWLRTVATYDPQRLLVNPYVARHLLDEHAAGRQGTFRRRRCRL